MLFAMTWLLAEDPPQQPPGGLFSSPLLILPVLLLLFWFFMIRPARRQEKERLNLLSQTKKNDKVQTASGILGTVVSMTDDEIVVKIDDSCRVRMVKGSITRNITQEEALKANAPSAGTTPAKPEEAAKG